MLFGGRKILILASIVCSFSFFGCAREKLGEMAGRVDYAEGQMKQLIEKGQKHKEQKDNRLESIRRQLEQDAERTKRQQEEALRKIENIKSAMSGQTAPPPPAEEQPSTPVVEGLAGSESVPAEVGPAEKPEAATPRENLMLADSDPRFQAAYADYSRGRYDLAIEAFDNLRQSHGEGISRARVEYFLGECYYNKSEFAKALTHFAAVGKYAAAEDLMAPSLWKRAMSYDKLNLPARRNEALQELVKRFPNSDEAGLAKEWLTGNAP